MTRGKEILELMAKLEEHPGTEAHRRLNALGWSVYTFDTNTRELLSMLDFLTQIQRAGTYRRFVAEINWNVQVGLTSGSAANFLSSGSGSRPPPSPMFFAGAASARVPGVVPRGVSSCASRPLGSSPATAAFVYRRVEATAERRWMRPRFSKRSL